MPDTASRPASAALPDTPRSDTEWGADKSLPRALLSILALDDFEEPARRYLPRPKSVVFAVHPETSTSTRGLSSISSNCARFARNDALVSAPPET